MGEPKVGELTQRGEGMLPTPSWGQPLGHHPPLLPMDRTCEQSQIPIRLRLGPAKPSARSAGAEGAGSAAAPPWPSSCHHPKSLPRRHVGNPGCRRRGLLCIPHPGVGSKPSISPPPAAAPKYVMTCHCGRKGCRRAWKARGDVGQRGLGVGAVG